MMLSTDIFFLSPQSWTELRYVNQNIQLTYVVMKCG